MGEDPVPLGGPVPERAEHGRLGPVRAGRSVRLGAVGFGRLSRLYSSRVMSCWSRRSSRTLSGAPLPIGADSVGAFHSVWTYDVPSGEVDRWHPPNQVGDVPVTHVPLYGGSCMTSMAAGGGAIWVTLAPANFASNGNSTCDLF